MPEHHEEEPSDLESGLEHEETAGEEQDHDSDMMVEDSKHSGDDPTKITDAPKPKLDAKDPLRPRRKKARRACFACQRAHLTCGMFCISPKNSCCPSSRYLYSICRDWSLARDCSRRCCLDNVL